MKKTIIIILILSVAAMLVSCNKNRYSGKAQDDTRIEIRVTDENGNSLSGITVFMLDKKGYELLKEQEGHKSPVPLTQSMTNGEGKAEFILKYHDWFTSTGQIELYFAVIIADGITFKGWWGAGGTINAGRRMNFLIKLEHSHPSIEIDKQLFTENNVLKGIKKEGIKRLELPDNIVSIADEAFLN